MKRIVCLVLALTMAAALLCGAMAEGETWLFAYANHNSDENSLRQMKAFCDAAEAWNEAGNTPRIETTTATAESDMQRQLADIDTMLAMGAKAIVIQGVDPVGIFPAVQTCLEQGVKVMEVRGANIDGILNLKIGDENVMGENMFSYLAAQLDANLDLKLNIGLLYGSAAQTAQLVRVDSCVALLQENYGDRITVLASQPCDWDTEKGQACMENWLQPHRDHGARHVRPRESPGGKGRSSDKRAFRQPLLHPEALRMRSGNRAVRILYRLGAGSGGE